MFGQIGRGATGLAAQRAPPCSSRSTTSNTGAATPMCAYGGNRPTPTVATPISTMVAMNVYLRPMRSPRRPKNNAPSGRTRKPAPKVARLARNAAVALPLGKNSVLKVAASAA